MPTKDQGQTDREVDRLIVNVTTAARQEGFLRGKGEDTEWANDVTDAAIDILRKALFHQGAEGREEVGGTIYAFMSEVVAPDALWNKSARKMYARRLAEHLAALRAEPQDESVTFNIVPLWMEIYTLCQSLGMRGDPDKNGQESVVAFIRDLYERGKRSHMPSRQGAEGREEADDELNDFQRGYIQGQRDAHEAFDTLRAEPQDREAIDTRAFAQGFEAGFFCGQKSDTTGPLTSRIVEAATKAWVDADPLAPPAETARWDASVERIHAELAGEAPLPADTAEREPVVVRHGVTVSDIRVQENEDGELTTLHCSCGVIHVLDYAPPADTDGEEEVWCPDCGAPHELVRPGKTQPTCDCTGHTGEGT